MNQVGIVIVTHNSEDEIGPCLDAAMAAATEVIVVDNASSDGTLAQLRSRRAAVIANPRNLGFAAAVNQGIRAIGSDHILLLNPDAVLETGVESLSAICGRPETGAVGGKLVDSHHVAQAGFNVRGLPTPWALAFEVLVINRLWPRNPVNWHYRCYGINLEYAAQVGQPAGAFMMFPRHVWELLGGLDEGFYPVWFEDVDFCKRAHDQGYYLYYEPRAVAVHQGGHSIRKILIEKRELYWYGNLLRYGFKHYRLGTARALCLAVIVGSLLRTAVGIAVQRSFKPLRVYSRVIRMAGQYLLFGPNPSGNSSLQ
jgi:N-acetylglucosaminyl-diphospho-decaprenol L-rhamnosyltransferase